MSNTNAPWAHRFANNQFFAPLRVMKIDELLDSEAKYRPEMRRYNPKPNEEPRPSAEAERQLEEVQDLLLKYEHALGLMSHYLLEADRTKLSPP